MTYLTRITLILAGLLAFAGCGSGEQVMVSFYSEGTGHGDFRVTTDEGQAIISGVGSGQSSHGELSAGSEVTLTVAAHPGSHFVGFGGDCSGTSSPLTFQLITPMTCSVRLEKD